MLANYQAKLLTRLSKMRGDKVLTKQRDAVKIFKDHFEKIVETLKIDHPILSDLSDDPVLNDIENFSHHASFLRKQETHLIAFPLN